MLHYVSVAFGGAQTGCPESKALLTLHNIGKMPPEIHRVVVAQLNKTRKDPGGKLWKPGPEAYMCNSHYVGFQGPIVKVA